MNFPLPDRQKPGNLKSWLPTLCALSILVFLSGIGLTEEDHSLLSGVDPVSVSAHKLLQNHLEERIAELRSSKSGTNDEDEIDDIEDELDILFFVRRELRHSPDGGARSVQARVDAYRILEALSADPPVQNLPPINELYRNIVLGTLFGHGVPLVRDQNRHSPTGKTPALEESRFLYSEKEARFLSPDDLAPMSPEQISKLDIGPHHPGWIRRSDIPGDRAGLVSDFEETLRRTLTQRLLHEGDLSPGRTYRFDEARRVLFLDEVYRSATSPKCETEDAFGVEWKLKWGDEPSVEPVANRLYLLAGARFTDLVFANGPGAAGVTLILNEPGSVDDDELTNEEERKAETVDQLATALDDFYGFDISPYLLGQGTITRENATKILKRLPSGGKEEYRTENLIGRQWITFRESGVELRPKGIVRREDGAPLSDKLALQDRVARGHYLFDLWIENRDVKYDNRKMFFPRQEVSGDWRVVSYYEGHHDLGLSLGGLVSSGQVNKFRMQNRFSSRGAAGKKARFKAPLIFKPESWNYCTWADARWMAAHISAISESGIRSAVATSLWPDFVQEALVYRLLDRRNQIAKLYDTTGFLDTMELSPPSVSVPLRTPQEIAAAEAKYGLPPGSLAEKRHERPAFARSNSELILDRGVIASHRKSDIVSLLIRHRHPSGLTDRYRRQSDKNPRALRR